VTAAATTAAVSIVIRWALVMKVPPVVWMP
jgi:hypothetical protein